MAAEPVASLSPRDLDHLAASIEVPSDLPWSARARAYLDVGIVGPDRRTSYQVVLAIDGARRDLPVGPVFLDRALACRLLHRLNGDVVRLVEPPVQLDLNLVQNTEMAAASLRLTAAAEPEVRDVRTISALAG